MLIRVIIKTLWKFIKVLVVGVVFTLGLIGYSIYIEPSLLIIKEAEYPIGKVTKTVPQKDKLKIIQFSDVHLGKYYSIQQLEKLVNKINTLEADIIVFTGDLIDTASTYEDIELIAPILGKLQASVGKFAIWGNHDYGGGAHRYYANIMEESGFTLLRNESVVVPIEKGKDLCISGLDDTLLGDPNVHQTFAKCKEADFHLALLHESDVAKTFVDYPIDLILAGHSHGGQINIPFLGPLVTTYLGSDYVKGLYTITPDKPNTLYVNTGIGTTKLPIRFNNPPEITVFYLGL